MERPVLSPVLRTQENLNICHLPGLCCEASKEGDGKKGWTPWHRLQEMDSHFEGKQRQEVLRQIKIVASCSLSEDLQCRKREVLHEPQRRFSFPQQEAGGYKRNLQTVQKTQPVLQEDWQEYVWSFARALRTLFLCHCKLISNYCSEASPLAVAISRTHPKAHSLWPPRQHTDQSGLQMYFRFELHRPI